MNKEIKNKKSAGIVYIDVSDYAKQLKSYGEYHKDKKRCYGAYRKARIIFLDDK